MFLCALQSNPPFVMPHLQTYGPAAQLAERRGDHVSENILHLADCGSVCGVRAPHLLGDVWDRLHQTLRQPQRRQVHHTFPGCKPETTGQHSGLADEL